MEAKIKGIEIAGISSCVPADFEINRDFYSIAGERKVKKQIRLTGIDKRHVLTEWQRSSDLVMVAVERLLAELGWEKSSIGVLIFVTQTGDYVIPSTAVALQDRLGLDKKCTAFDINLGCSAFNYGLHTAAAILNSSEDYSRGICLIADGVKGLATCTAIQPDSISYSMLSGSAGAAIALEKRKDAGMLFSELCDGSRFDAIVKRSMFVETQMKGNMVFDFAINDVSDNINQFKKDYHLSEDDIDYYVLHQAQQLIIRSIMDACSMPEEKVLISYDEYGNTSGVSVPLTLCANRKMVSKKKRIKVLFCGFGVGLSSGITYLEMDTDHILDVTETSGHYDEDKEPAGKLSERKILLLDADTERGRFFASFFDKMSASLVLCGHKEDALVELQKNIFWDSDIIACRTEEQLVELAAEKGLRVNAVIGDSKALTIAEKLAARSCFDDTEEGSVVVLDDIRDGISEIDFKKDVRYRTNVVEYNSESLKFPESVSMDYIWPKEYFEENLPRNMTRCSYLAYVICWLMDKDSKMVSQSRIAVRED